MRRNVRDKERNAMGFMRAIYDQTIKARGIAKRLCQDYALVTRLGLNELPADQRVRQLHPRVGFVLSFYGSSQACFRAFPTMSADEKLMMVMARRFKGIRHIPDGDMHALNCWSELANDHAWKNKTLQRKFMDVCARTFAEEEYAIRGIPVGAVLNSSIAEEIMNAIFRQEHFDLRS